MINASSDGDLVMSTTIGCDRSPECLCCICRAFRKYKDAPFNTKREESRQRDIDFCARLEVEINESLALAEEEILVKVKEDMARKSSSIKAQYRLIIKEFLL